MTEPFADSLQARLPNTYGSVESKFNHMIEHVEKYGVDILGASSFANDLRHLRNYTLNLHEKIWEAEEHVNRLSRSNESQSGSSANVAIDLSSLTNSMCNPTAASLNGETAHLDKTPADDDSATVVFTTTAKLSTKKARKKRKTTKKKHTPNRNVLKCPPKATPTPRKAPPATTKTNKHLKDESDDESVILLDTIPIPSFRQQTLTQMIEYPPTLQVPSFDEEESEMNMFSTQAII